MKDAYFDSFNSLPTPMRVLMLSPVYPHAASPSEGVFIQQQVNALSCLGIEVELLVCKPRLPEWAARRLKRYRHLRGLNKNHHGADGIHFVRYWQIPQYRTASLTIDSCVQAIMRPLTSVALKSFDLIHAQSTWPTGLAAPRLSEKLGLPFLVTLHIQDDAALVQGSGRYLYADMLRHAAGVVAVSSPLARFVETIKPPGANVPVTIVPNGVGVEFKELASAGTRVGRDEERTRIVSVGNLWKIKGIDLVLGALKELDRQGISNWRYTIVGDGPERTALESLAVELGIGARVVFAGALPRKQALAHIATSDIFVLPSWNEAFGIVYLEAMAYGKPVIGCRGQGAEDIVLDGETGYLVEPKNVHALADALKILLTSPTRIETLGNKGRERVASFSWGANATRYSQLYQETMLASPARLAR